MSLRSDSLREFVVRGDVADIEANRQRSGAPSFDLRHHRPCRVGAGEVGDDDIGAILGQVERGGAPDAAASARDECDSGDRGVYLGVHGILLVIGVLRR